MMRSVLSDVRFGCRLLARHPGFTAAAVLTLALGIGATATMFSFVNGVLLKPLPYRDSDRLVSLSSLPARATAPVAVSPGDFLEWQAQNRTFDAMAAFTMSRYTLTGAGEPVRVFAAMVTPAFAEMLGVSPIAGRTLDAAARAAVPSPILISAHVWRSRFHSSAQVTGTSILVDGDPFTVVGVMPDGFSFPRDVMASSGTRGAPDVDVWMPLTPRPGYRANAFLQVVGRLKQTVTIEQARDDMRAVAGALAERYPEDRDAGVRIVALREHIVAGVRRLLYTLFGAVGLLLLIACANVANLLLGRASGREREAAIRTALGSGRRRLIQQYLTESVVLGLIGGAAGILAAGWGLDIVAALIPRGVLPRLADVHLDRTVVLFSVLASLTTGVIFGVAPAVQAATTDVNSALKGNAGAHTGSTRALNALIIAQVAIAFVLVTASGLLAKSFWRLTSVDPGFKPDRILAVDVTLPDGSYRTLTEMRAFAAAVLDRVRATAGVIDAGAVNLLPIGGSLLSGDFIAENIARPAGLVATKPSVSPGYFRAMGIPMLRGRDFDPGDTADAPGVAIVTDGLARRLWPRETVLGKRLKLGFGRPDDQPWLTVTGVVADVKQTALKDEAKPAIYVPIAQAPRPFLLRELSFVVRTSGEPQAVASAIREDIRGVDAMLPIGRVATMDQLISESVSEPRFRALLLGAFAASALTLIAIGMLGVLGYAVVRRTREIGVRMALGAQRIDVIGLVVRQALWMAAAGIAVGVILSLAAMRILSTFLFEISAHDPLTYVASAAALAVLALMASYVPARRAVRVDPLDALRME